MYRVDYRLDVIALYTISVRLDTASALGRAGGDAEHVQGSPARLVVDGGLANADASVAWGQGLIRGPHATRRDALRRDARTPSRAARGAARTGADVPSVRRAAAPLDG